MDKPIMITANDIAAICALILSISAVVALIFKIFEHFKAPDKHQNERITSLEEEVKRINDQLELDDKRFAADTDRLQDLEREMNNTNKIMLESLQALIDHSIDGNNVDQMKTMKMKLGEFLLERR